MTLLNRRRLPLACLALCALPHAHADHPAADLEKESAWRVSGNAAIAVLIYQGS